VLVPEIFHLHATMEMNAQRIHVIPVRGALQRQHPGYATMATRVLKPVFAAVESALLVSQ